MVSISIMLLIATVVLARFSSFDSAVILRNLAFDVAISLREAQVLSISVLGDGSSFRGVYGVHFDTETDPNIYHIFRDGVGGIKDEKFQTGEIFETFNINNDYHIKDLCYTIGTIETCGNKKLTVTFKRPNVDARFDIGGGVNTSIVSARIEVQANNNTSLSRDVIVGFTGQISVP